MQPRPVQPGFTLVELMATLAIAAILIAVSTPVLEGVASNTAARSALGEFQNHVAYARMLAVARNEPVTLCPSSDGRTCTTSNVWSEGWIVFRDPAHAAQPAGPDAIVQRALPPSPRVRMQSTAGRTRIRFLPTGWASGTNVTLDACIGGRSLGRVVINNAGRARSESSELPCPPA